MPGGRQWTVTAVAAGVAVGGCIVRVARPDSLSAQQAETGGPLPAACPLPAGQPAGAAVGRPIRAIVVVTTPPDRWPGGLQPPLHVTTRPEAVRGRLLFAVGDAVDTARIAESVRQLQALPYLAGAQITAACDASGAVTLTVATHDAWSLRPEFAIHGGQRASVGVSESNLFGTGRVARLYARSDLGQLGVGAAYADPTLAGGRAIGSVHRDAYPDGRAWGAALRTWDAGVFSPWNAGIAVEQTERASVQRTVYTAPGDTVRRATALALVSRRVARSPDGALYVRVGAEAERTALVAGPALPIVGPADVRRTFVGADVGLARRSARYLSVPWLLPAGSAPLRLGLTRPDVPIGFTVDGLVSLGRDLTANRAATHVDLWAGRVVPIGDRPVPERANESSAPRALLSADVWASGYHPLAGGAWSAGTLRGSLGAIAPASHGLWSARISGEYLADPDPDMRSLALLDPAQRAVPVSRRLAESAITGSIERSRDLLGLTRNYVLGVALFAAGSVRWEGAAPDVAGSTPTAIPLRTGGVDDRDPDPPLYGRLYVGSVGAGLRITPTHFGPATIRLDVGMPVVRSAGLHGRPFVGVAITPSFGIGRHRDGRTALGGP